MPKNKRNKLTDLEWERVFNIRCRSKRGEGLSETEQAFVAAAYKDDHERYVGLNEKINKVTRPWPDQDPSNADGFDRDF